MKNISNPDRPWLKGATNLFDVPGKPFGWAHAEEKQKIFDELVAEGYDPEGYHIRFEATRRQEELHKNDLSWGECQRLKREWDAIHNPQPKGSSIWFSEEELQYLREKLYGVNDTTGRDILEKISVYFSEE